jgi:hypothetical protein
VAQDRTARRSTARPRPEHRLNGTGRDPHTSCLRSWHVLAVLETLDGILVLLKSELPEESAFLARSLFEDSLRLKQLQEEPEARIALVLGWVNRSLNEKRGLMQTAKSIRS